jgi:hypothetical protein
MGVSRSQAVYSETATLSNVAAAATSAQLLAANPDREGAVFFNDADKALYLKFGTTASATSFTIKIAAGGNFTLPAPIYTGRIDGIWETDPTGAVRITELT